MAIHQVENISKVDPTKYMDGDLFIGKRSSAILLNGKLETIMTRNEVKKLIQSEIRKVKKDVQKTEISE